MTKTNSIQKITFPNVGLGDRRSYFSEMGACTVGRLSERSPMKKKFEAGLTPEGDRTHSMTAGKNLQVGANARAGNPVHVVLAKDDKERIVTIPKELEDALRKNQKAASTFATLAPSHKKEYADWISTAKKQATKISRVQKAIEMLAAGKRGLR